MEEIHAHLSSHLNGPEHGAELLFFGVIRNHNRGRKVLSVEYDVHAPLAEVIFREIYEEVQSKWGPNLAVTISHRVGRVEIGEISLAVGVSTPHRHEAYQISRTIVDHIKHRAPIWKKEVYEDGETEWLDGHALCESFHLDRVSSPDGI